MLTIIGSPERSARGVSAPLAVILLMFIVVASVGAMLAVAGPAFDEIESRANLDRAEVAMAQIDSQASRVALGQEGIERFELPDGSDSRTYVDESAGTMSVVVTASNGTETELLSGVTMGAIVYEQGETTVAYQGGGVWRKSGDSATMVSPPEFHYLADGPGEPTLTLPLVTVRGTANSGDVTVRRQSRVQKAPTAGLKNPLEGGRVKITVTSEYYEAWGAFFEQRTSGAVTYPGGDSVTIELVVPSRTAVVESPVVSDAGSIGVSNHGAVDSYNSNDGPYAAPGGDDASVIVDGDFVQSNHVVIRGEVRATGDARISNDPHIVGRVRIDGSSTVSNDPTFDSGYHTGGDLAVSGSARFGEDVVVGGHVSQFQKATVEGDLHVGGDAVIGRKSHIKGDVIVGGSVSIRDTAQVDGTIYAGGDVEVASGAEHPGDVVSSGDVLLKSSRSRIAGDVHAGGAVDLGWKAEIGGSVVSRDDVNLTPQSTIGGDVRTGGTVAGGTVVGDVLQNRPVSLPSLRVPERPVSADATIPPSAGPTIDAKRDSLTSENDNAGASVISGSTLVDCESTCELTSGQYSLTNVQLDGSETLKIDTTSGPVSIYVDGQFSMSNDAQIAVVGDSEVEFYLNDDVAMSNDATVTVEGDRAPLLWLYMRPGSSAQLSNDVSLTGVIYGPESQSERGVSVGISNHVVVKGAIVGSVSGTSNHNQLHYDSALRSSVALDRGITVPQVTYMHISVNELRVEDR